MHNAKRICAALILGGLFLPRFLNADEPLDKQQRKEFFSTHHRYGAISDTRPMITTVFRIDANNKRIPVWAIPGWFRIAAVSDDGEHLLTGYSGVNLIPQRDAQPLETVILTDYLHGKKIKTVQLKEIVPTLESLQKTANHYLWGEYVGWQTAQRYGIKTVDGPLWEYDIQTKTIQKKGT